MYSEPSLSVHIFVYNSYLTVIGVHGILLVVDLCSSLAYFMMIQPLPIAGKFPIKTLVARQLPTNVHVYIYICSEFHTEWIWRVVVFVVSY